MGRTVPTFVQLIQQAAERWKKFRRALRREDQPHFDRLFVRVRCYTQAATYQAHDNPMESRDRKSTRLNSSHGYISYAVFCLKKKKKQNLAEHPLSGRSRR